MLNEKLLRPFLFIMVAAIHAVLLLFLNFTVQTVIQKVPENARVMRVMDFSEVTPLPPPPPPPPQKIVETDLPQVEAIAEVMIETDTVPEQIVVAPGTLTTTFSVTTDAESSWDDYIPIHRVSDPPSFDERDISAALVYPPIALRSGIEGRVILELFVDRNGVVQRIIIMQENPRDRGFGEAAVKAFTGRVGIPAMANGEPVSTRYRYPVSFRIK
jgi:protein TonB